jgi:hypothetical protein
MKVGLEQSKRKTNCMFTSHHRAMGQNRNTKTAITFLKHATNLGMAMINVALMMKLRAN